MPLSWGAAIGDRTHGDFDPGLVFAHGAGCCVDFKADNAAEHDISGHYFGL